MYRGGVVLAPLARVRGLEFDAVLIWDASRRMYPDTPEAGRRIYIAHPRPAAGRSAGEFRPGGSHESVGVGLAIAGTVPAH